MKKIISCLAVAVAVPAAFGFSCAAQSKTLIYCTEASPGGFDPALYIDDASYNAAAWPVYSRLVEFAHGSFEIIPSLATYWDISADGKTYIFHLRQGVKFQKTAYFTPGRNLNTDDVVFGFRRQMDKNNPWHSYMIGANYQKFETVNMQKTLQSIEKLDDNTVKFILVSPNAGFLSNLASAFASILSKEYADNLESGGKMENLNSKPVGSGPFVFTAYQKDAFIRFKANPDYWEGKPALDKVIFAITPDSAMRIQKLRNGECHVAGLPNPQDIPALEADKNINVMRGPANNIGYLAYNIRQKPFDKAEVRRALNMAVNKQKLVDIVYGGYGTAGINPLPPSSWAYDKTIPQDEYNPEKAGKLLREAGVRNLSVKIWAMPVARPYMPNGRRAAEIIQSYWKAVGVDSEIVTAEWGAYTKLITDPDHDGAIIIGWTGSNGDPDNFMATLNSCAAIPSGNLSGWCNREYDSLIDKAVITNNQEERIKLYRKAQEIFHSQAPWLTIGYNQNIRLAFKRVKNFIADAQAVRFEKADME